ncbi:hypothetical protein BC833DRAFT_607872 [Globomyces pollinis-pini]|nr:hypothetical protein BC833DRAFT_607872 [Globomyces pollinis-pini]KAJ2987681.1 hypothetical protein HDV02_006006 [Globomyces sp. JEL0801]
MVSFTNLLLLSATALAMPAKPQVCTPVLREHQTTGLGTKAIETINQVILPAFRKDLATNGVAWVLSYQSDTKNKVEQSELVRAVGYLTGEHGLVFLRVECKENPSSYMSINTAIH